MRPTGGELTQIYALFRKSSGQGFYVVYLMAKPIETSMDFTIQSLLYWTFVGQTVLRYTWKNGERRWRSEGHVCGR